jgi:ABC-2 type transport system ATP-binding protein
MSDYAISVTGLTKRFDDVTAVDDVRFSVPYGSVTALLGGNGAGKTTTIAMLLGLLTPSAGVIHILGKDMRRDRAQVMPRLNFSSPYVDLPHRLTVRENLTVYAMLYGVKNARQRVATLMTELNLEDFAKRPTGKLSAGQKTRVALAKALINRPDLLLLDEPTASLDPDTADWARTYLKAIQASSGATIMLASHNMAEVERMADNVLMMKAGRIVDQGAPDTLIAKYGRQSLEEVFLDIARGRDLAVAS